MGVKYGVPLAQAIQQTGENPLAGIPNIFNALLGIGAAPFAEAEQAVRSIPGGGAVADVATLPFRAVGEAGAKTIPAELIQAIMGQERGGQTAEALQNMMSGAGQVMMGGAFKKPRVATEQMPIPAPEGLRTASELQTELPLQTSFKRDMIQKLGGKDVETRFGKVGTLSDADLTRVYQEQGLDVVKTGNIGPITKAGEPVTPDLVTDMNVAGGSTNIVNPVAKVIEAIKGAKPIREQTEALYHLERSKRAGQLARVYETPQGEQTLPRALSTQKGELPKATFEPIRDKITQGDIDALHNQVIKSDLSVYERLQAQLALDKLFTKEGGAVPTRGELSLLEDVFGTEFVDAVKGKMSGWQRFKSLAVDLANVPRTVMAAFDMSMPFRQAAIQTFSHPIKSLPAWKEMHKSFFSERSFKAVKEELANRPNATLYKEFKLDILDPDKQHGPLTQREEAFTSHLAERIPFVGKGVRMAERAAYTFTNKVRADVFDMYAQELRKAGITPEKNPAHYSALAKWVNISTGRGSFGGFTRYAPTASALMFSPRLLASRFQVMAEPFRYQSVPKEVRVMAMKDMIKFSSAVTGMLTLAKAGGAQVTLDPRSSDFGKMKFGNTRIDPLAGFSQIMRFFAQLTTGQRVNTQGKVTNMTGENPFVGSRLQTIYRFGESKLNPHVGFLVDFLRGKNFAGEPFNLTEDAIQHLAPLYLQDAYDAINDKEFAKGLFISLPGFYGMGVQTYKPRTNPFQSVGSDVLR